MATVLPPPPLPLPLPTLADTLAQLSTLGDIPAERILMWPLPGTASIHDLTHVHASGLQLVELVDGVLVEKAMGTRESFLSALILRALGNFVEQHNLGVCLGADGFVRLGEGVVRAPDAAFIPWDRWLNVLHRPENYLPVHPDLIVEVRSPSNTDAEIDRKLRDFHEAGTRLAWIIDPQTQTARVYTSPTVFTALDPDGILDGGDVLPGFQLPLADLFRRTQPRGET